MRSQAWAKKREQALAHYGRRCFVCGKTKGPIHVHHLTYARFGGRESMSDLRPLCQTCHREVTKLHWKMGRRKYTGLTILQMFMKSKGSRPIKRKR